MSFPILPTTLRSLRRFRVIDAAAAIRAIWNWGGYVRVGVVLGSAILLAVLWAAARLQVFMMMTGETGVWNDFGGWLFPSLFVFFTWAALYHGIKYFQFLQREQEIAVRAESAQRQEALKRMKAESQTKAAQLQLLRYQLNPHFLFNTLNAVSSLITAARGDDANSMLLKLSTFLRFALERDDMTLTTLREELMAIELYLDIEKVRFSDRLTVSLRSRPTPTDVACQACCCSRLSKTPSNMPVYNPRSGRTRIVPAATVDRCWRSTTRSRQSSRGKEPRYDLRRCLRCRHWSSNIRDRSSIGEQCQ